MACSFSVMFLIKVFLIHYKELKEDIKHYKEQFVFKILYKELSRFLFLTYQHSGVIFIIAQVIYSCYINVVKNITK
ncbi:hypothetical protein CN981_00045 [Priestia megaterium]|nr:hypothetical protein CN981_00045 [Priestia megaterium]